MSEMIQRVARRIAASGEIVISAPPNPHEGCACMGCDPGEPACRCVMAAAHVAARIAIEEMREPTTAMMRAADAEDDDYENATAGEHWQAMIASALKP